MTADLVPVGEAARAAGRKSLELLRLIEQGKLPAVRIDGRVMVSPEDVEQLVGSVYNRPHG